MVAGTAAVDKGAGTSEEIPTGLAAFASVPVAGSSHRYGRPRRSTCRSCHGTARPPRPCTRRIGERSSRSSPVCHGLHDGHPFRAMSPDRGCPSRRVKPTAEFYTARQAWLDAVSVDAAQQGEYWDQAAADLRPTAQSRPAYAAIVKTLNNLASLPDSSATPAQQHEFGTDMAIISRFFDTPYLG